MKEKSNNSNEKTLNNSGSKADNFDKEKDAASKASVQNSNKNKQQPHGDEVLKEQKETD